MTQTVVEFHDAFSMKEVKLRGCPKGCKHPKAGTIEPDTELTPNNCEYIQMYHDHIDCGANFVVMPTEGVERVKSAFLPDVEYRLVPHPLLAQASDQLPTATSPLA